MQEERYEVAGWVTVASASLMIIGGVLGVIMSLMGYSFSILNPITLFITIVQVGCSVYGFLWFKRLLNNRFEFHEVDTLIILLIICNILISVIGSVFRTVIGFSVDDNLSRAEALSVILPGLIAMASVGIPMSIFGIIFGVRLMRLKESLFGYLRPLAYTQIIGSALMLTFFLAPIGGLVLLAGEVLQAMILIQSGRTEPELEFV